MSFRLGVFVAAAVSLTSVASASAAFDITFAGENGATTPLTIASGDNVLTFTSMAGAGAGTFTVADSGIYTGFGLGLGDYRLVSGDPLTISFATPVTGLGVTFGIEDLDGLRGNDTLTFTTNTGVSTTLAGALNGASVPEPEGTGAFSAPAFTSVTITSANPFAIGAVTSGPSTPASVPEPMSLALVGAGLAGAAALRRRVL